MQLLAIDLGYGYTKVKFGDHEFKFPSAIAHAGSVGSNFASTTSYDFEGDKYYVGDEKAVRDSILTTGYGFLEKFAPLLLFKALEMAKVDFDEKIVVATGLSILNWNEHEKFVERLKSFTINGRHYNFKIKLFAQGQGVFYDYFGKNGNDSLNIVFDMGYLTNDFIVFENNKPYVEQCFANDKGVNKIIQDVQNSIQRQFNVQLSEAKINQAILSNSFKHFGEEIDVTDLVFQAKKNYLESTVLSLKNTKPRLIADAENIILSGGGAYLFDKEKFFPNISTSNDPYEFANVRGYHVKTV